MEIIYMNWLKSVVLIFNDGKSSKGAYTFDRKLFHNKWKISHVSIQEFSFDQALQLVSSELFYFFSVKSLKSSQLVASNFAMG